MWEGQYASKEHSRDPVLATGAANDVRACLGGRLRLPPPRIQVVSSGAILSRTRRMRSRDCCAAVVWPRVQQVGVEMTFRRTFCKFVPKDLSRQDRFLNEAIIGFGMCVTPWAGSLMWALTIPQFSRWTTSGAMAVSLA